MLAARVVQSLPNLLFHFFHDVDASKIVEEVEQQIWKTLHHARGKH